MRKRSAGKRAAQSGVVVGTELGSGREVVLSGPEARAHLFCCGVTGSGKSKLLGSLVVQKVNRGESCVVLDPHGDLLDDILGVLWDTGFYQDQRAFSRVRYVSFSGESGRYPPFNVLAQTGQSSHDTARWVWTAMSRAWSGIDGGAAPLMEQVMLAGLYVLAENQLPLPALNRLMADATYRARLLTPIKDRQVLEFFARLEASGGKRSGMLSESALRRAFLLSFTPALRYSLGSQENLFDLRACMDQGVTLLCDLSTLDEDSQRMLGCLVTVAAETAALSRADLPEARRRPANLILDEWSMFSAQSDVALERMLALCRKYGLSVTLACQTLGQTTRKLQSALQNCIPIVLRLGGLDADWGAARVGTYEAQELKTTARGAPTYVSRGEQLAAWADRLERLPARHAVVRLGDETIPFYTLGLPPARCSRAELQALKAEYARRWLHVPEEGNATEEQQDNSNRSAAGPGKNAASGAVPQVRRRSSFRPREDA